MMTMMKLTMVVSLGQNVRDPVTFLSLNKWNTVWRFAEYYCHSTNKIILKKMCSESANSVKAAAALSGSARLHCWSEAWWRPLSSDNVSYKAVSR